MEQEDKKQLDRFLFYRSYYESGAYLVKGGDWEGFGRLMFAISDFVLNGKEPSKDSLPDSVMPLWLLVRPTLEVSRNKALAGSKGGEISRGGGRPKKEQAENKQKTSRKQPIKEIRNKEIRNKDIISISSSLQSSSVCDGEKNFAIWWDLYDKKVGKEKARKSFLKLTKEEQEKCIAIAPQYKASTPEKRYRKNPQTYLNQKSFNDEIIHQNGNNQQEPNKRDLAILQSQRNLIDNVSETGEKRTDISKRLPFG